MNDQTEDKQSSATRSIRVQLQEKRAVDKLKNARKKDNAAVARETKRLKLIKAKQNPLTEEAAVVSLFIYM